MHEPGKKIDLSALKNISILYIEDDRILREKVLEFLKMRFSAIYSAENGREGVQLFEQVKPDLVITDIKMPIMSGLEAARIIKKNNPNTPVIILTAFSEVNFLMEAIEIGVDGYVQKPTDGEKLLVAIHKCLLPLVQKKEIETLTEDVHSSLEMMLGKSEPIRNIVKQVRQVARSNFSVIIQGETGVGKSMIARIIHDLSDRANKPFVVVDIGSIPETLVESELFGYKKGAFTGAVKDKKGFFETGSGGTVFLDELENMNPYVQGKLLRAVEDRTVYPLGSSTPVAIDIRLIGATNKDLSLEVKEKKFREDLFYRLCEFSFIVPPLRERKEDIRALAKKFYAEAANELGKTISEIDEEALELLMNFQWNGNVRELKNTMRRIALVSENDRVTEEDIKRIVTISPGPGLVPGMEPGNPGSIPFYPLSEVEKWAIRKALAMTNGKKLQTASLLDIDYKTLVSKIKKYGI